MATSHEQMMVLLLRNFHHYNETTENIEHKSIFLDITFAIQQILEPEFDSKISKEILFSLASNLSFYILKFKNIVRADLEILSIIVNHCYIGIKHVK